MVILSKSKLLAYRQCPKRLWLEVHRPELREEMAKDEGRMQVGHHVTEIARRLYDPQGSGTLIDPDAEGFTAAFARTHTLVNASSAPIFEAGFQAGGGLAFADLLLLYRKGKPKAWSLVEVKSSAEVKDYHYDDLAIQTHVVRSAGVKLKSVSLAHIDSSWTYPGGGDYRGLLKENDLTTESFGRDAAVRQWIAEAQQVVAQPNEPERDVGPHCYDPFECGFCAYCNRNTPQAEFPIDWLPRLHPSKRERLTALGVTDLRHAPDDLLTDVQALVKRQSTEKSVFFDAAGAAADLAPYGFPAYFLDFETINLAVPIWAGIRPYQQIAFQFSLHTLDHAGNLGHSSFLDVSGNDPSAPFVMALIEACGKTGPVFVYNQAFETARISELADRFPDFGEALNAINARIVDLLPIARERYYHPSQCGSWSIKAVLPAAVPELSYDKLDGVQDGGAAMDAFQEAINPETSSSRKAEIKKQLLEYCSLDTFAMLRLWQFFSGRVQTP